MKILRKIFGVVICIILITSMSGCDNVKDTERKLESDSYDPWAETSFVVSDEDGYYIATYENKLCSYDLQSKQMVPLCHKTQCEHDTQSCDSYFIGITSGKVMSYGDKLYVATFYNNTLELYQINKDGENRKKVCTLFQGKKNLDIGTSINICDNYVYFSVNEFLDSGENTSKLYRKKLVDNEEVLEESEEEFIYANEEDMSSSSLSLMHEYNEVVYFTDIYTLKGDNEKVYGKLYSYNPDEKKLTEEAEDIASEFFICNNKVFYQNSGETIKTYDLTTKETKDFCAYDEANKRLDISYDGKYVYADNFLSCYGNDSSERKITVYDLNGTVVDEIIPEYKEGECLFGDERNLVLAYDGVFYFYDKNQIGNDGEVWTAVYPNTELKEQY